MSRSLRELSLPPAGFEPATYGLEIRQGNDAERSATAERDTTCANHAADASQKCLANCPSPDAQLRTVMHAWAALSEPVRAGIVAMIMANQ